MMTWVLIALLQGGGNYPLVVEFTTQERCEEARKQMAPILYWGKITSAVCAKR